jgi:hypothetical protein
MGHHLSAIYLRVLKSAKTKHQTAQNTHPCHSTNTCHQVFSWSLPRAPLGKSDNRGQVTLPPCWMQAWHLEKETRHNPRLCKLESSIEIPVLFFFFLLSLRVSSWISVTVALLSHKFIRQPVQTGPARKPGLCTQKPCSHKPQAILHKPPFSPGIMGPDTLSPGLSKTGFSSVCGARPQPPTQTSQGLSLGLKAEGTSLTTSQG